jgi:hypothetical protein
LWFAVLKNPNTFKGIAMIRVENGSTVFLWHDLWSNKVRSLESAKLFLFSVRYDISLITTDRIDNIHDLFQLPLSDTAYQQFLLLNSKMDNLTLSEDNDVWHYIWGNGIFQSKELMRQSLGTPQHIMFSSCYGSLNVSQSIRFSSGSYFMTS